MKLFVSAIGGLALIVSSIGCCCSQGCQPYYGGGGGFGGGCPTGNCPPAGGMVYPQQGANYTPYNAYAAAPTMASPYGQYQAYPATAAAPIESLPTY